MPYMYQKQFHEKMESVHVYGMLLSVFDFTKKKFIILVIPFILKLISRKNAIRLVI